MKKFERVYWKICKCFYHRRGGYIGWWKEGQGVPGHEGLMYGHGSRP